MLVEMPVADTGLELWESYCDGKKGVRCALISATQLQEIIKKEGE